MYSKKIERKTPRTINPKARQLMEKENSKLLNDNTKLRRYLAKELKINDKAHQVHKGRYDDRNDNPIQILKDLTSKAFNASEKFAEGSKIIQRTTLTDEGKRLLQELISKGNIDESNIICQDDIKSNSLLLIISTTEENVKLHVHLKETDKDTVLDIKRGDSTYLLYLEAGNINISNFLSTCISSKLLNSYKNRIYLYKHTHRNVKYLNAEELSFGDYF